MKYFYHIIILLLSTLSSRSQTINVDSLRSKDNLLLYNGKPFTGTATKQLWASSHYFVFQTSEIYNGIYDGITVFKRPNGEQIGGGVYEKGIKNGYWIDVKAHMREALEPYYRYSKGKYESGTKVGDWLEEGLFGKYKDGKMDGVWTSYYDKLKKNKESQGNYILGKKEGVWNYWNEKGQIVCTRNFISDSMNGAYKSYGYRSIFFGKKVIRFKQFVDEIGSYSKNVRSDIWIEFGSDNDYKIVGEYINGKQEGVWVHYFKEEVVRKDYYKNGVLLKYTYFSKNKNGDKIEKEVLNP